MKFKKSTFMISFKRSYIEKRKRIPLCKLLADKVRLNIIIDNYYK